MYAYMNAHAITFILGKKKNQITCLEKQMVYLKKRFNFVNSSLLLYALFLSVIMRYVIMVYHISGVFIYLKTNSHAVFISLWFRQKKFFKLFFLLLSKWRPTLMKIFPQSHMVGQAKAELRAESQLWAYRHLVGWAILRQFIPIHFIFLPGNACPFYCVGVSYLPVTSGWKTGATGVDMVVSDSHSARGSCLAESLFFLTRLCCLPWGSSCAIPDKTIFSFTVFCQWSKSEMSF